MIVKDYEDAGWEVLVGGWPDFLAIRRDGDRIVEAKFVKVRRRPGELNADQARLRDALVGLKVGYAIEVSKSEGEEEGEDGLAELEMAIFDPEAPTKLLAAAHDVIDWGLAWCMLKHGMHPEQVRQLSEKKNIAKGGVFYWTRVKNGKPLRSLLSEEDLRKLTEFLVEWNRSRLSREQIWKRIKALTKRAGFDGGPRVLRKTFILNELRANPDNLDIVAQRAGCTRAVLLRHYIDLQQWERMNDESKPARS